MVSVVGFLFCAFYDLIVFFVFFKVCMCLVYVLWWQCCALACRYHLKDVIVGKIYFLLVRIKIKHMELQVIKRETTGTGIGYYSVNTKQTLWKPETGHKKVCEGRMCTFSWVRLGALSCSGTPYHTHTNRVSLREDLKVRLMATSHAVWNHRLKTFERKWDQGEHLGVGRCWTQNWSFETLSS